MPKIALDMKKARSRADETGLDLMFLDPDAIVAARIHLCGRKRSAILQASASGNIIDIDIGDLTEDALSLLCRHLRDRHTASSRIFLFEEYTSDIDDPTETGSYLAYFDSTRIRGLQVPPARMKSVTLSAGGNHNFHLPRSSFLVEEIASFMKQLSGNHFIEVGQGESRCFLTPADIVALKISETGEHREALLYHALCNRDNGTIHLKLTAEQDAAIGKLVMDTFLSFDDGVFVNPAYVMALRLVTLSDGSNALCSESERAVAERMLTTIDGRKGTFSKLLKAYRKMIAMANLTEIIPGRNPMAVCLARVPFLSLLRHDLPNSRTPVWQLEYTTHQAGEILSDIDASRLRRLEAGKTDLVVIHRSRNAVIRLGLNASTLVNAHVLANESSPRRFQAGDGIIRINGITTLPFTMTSEALPKIRTALERHGLATIETEEELLVIDPAEIYMVEAVKNSDCLKVYLAEQRDPVWISGTIADLEAIARRFNLVRASSRIRVNPDRIWVRGRTEGLADLCDISGHQLLVSEKTADRILKTL